MTPLHAVRGPRPAHVHDMRERSLSTCCGLVAREGDIWGQTSWLPDWWDATPEQLVTLPACPGCERWHARHRVPPSEVQAVTADTTPALQEAR